MRARIRKRAGERRASRLTINHPWTQWATLVSLLTIVSPVEWLDGEWLGSELALRRIGRPPMLNTINPPSGPPTQEEEHDADDKRQAGDTSYYATNDWADGGLV